MKTTVRSKPFSCELAPRGYVAPGPWGLGTAALASALPTMWAGRSSAHSGVATAGGPTLRWSKVVGDDGLSLLPGAWDLVPPTPALCQLGRARGQASVATLGSLLWEHGDQEAAGTNQASPQRPAVCCSHSRLLPASLRHDRAPSCW